MSYMQELYKLGKNILVRRLKDAMWRLPKWSNLKINFDVVFNKQESRSCSRIVIRDSNGGVLRSKTVMNDNIPLTFAMKVLACIQTAQMGLGMGLPVVEVECVTSKNRVSRNWVSEPRVVTSSF
ncbi:hypothetical protein Gohar_015900 [Gossypium harknessii]|uniref:RNase H type-1 domain-containing protein n=1 Tax=Gossypium harknessii TaxID=34285 RepID=A0A7J9G1N6_9ROSI|nr:hypothetical protein [Gossypium harknessii]